MGRLVAFRYRHDIRLPVLFIYVYRSFLPDFFEMQPTWRCRKFPYTAVLNNTGIPDRLNIFNTDPNNQPGSLPVAPFECILDYSGVPGYYGTRIVGADNFTEAAARQLVFEDLRRMNDAGTFPINRNPEIIALESHAPTSMMVSVEDVRDGFYKRLYALQGQRSTYYTGYSFCTDYSAQLWNYTRVIVDMVESTLLQ